MKVIGTTKISYEIEQILDNARDFLILVSPYLKLNQRLKVKLSDAFKKVNSVFVLYRENEIKTNELKWLNSFDSLHIISIKNLHSKMYISQDFGIISSMNLYEYSQINNHEIGVKIDRYEDAQAYEDMLNEIRIIFASEHESDEFDNIITSIQDYSMGTLFNQLLEFSTFGNQGYKHRSQALYEFISNKARKIVDIKEDELYQDHSAILRGTNLGRERYSTLKKKLQDFAD